ncbi:MAG: hypothetical protein HKN62_11410 [Phycisphaerales bacterium]|nr:hypothetical protein [Phycisphaerales bacterium]
MARRDRSWGRSGMLACGLGLCVASMSGAGDESILYVDAAAPGGDGTSWATALRSLQDGLSAAQRARGLVSEVRVAGGTYRPDDGETQTAGDRSASFSFVGGVAVRGGFGGLAAADPDTQDPIRFPTVLDGDLLGDDEPDFTNRSDNAYHVVRGVTGGGGGTGDDTRLEHVVIRGGNADGRTPDDRGGGVLLTAGPTPRLVECVIEDNDARHGGGVSVAGAAVFESVLVQDNRAALSGGGAHLAGDASQWDGGRFLSNRATLGAGVFADGSTATLDGTEFRDNAADFEGGGLAADGGGLDLLGCRFTRNVSAGDGGGLALTATATTLSSCKFVENTAERGGGARLLGDASTLVTCTFLDNTAGTGGGLAGINADVQLASCPFTGNEAETGGGLSLVGGVATIAGGRWTDNLAGEHGGGVDAVDAVTSLFACTFLDNEAGELGGGVRVHGGTATIEACGFEANVVEALFVNNGGGVYVHGAGTLTLRDSVFRANRAQFGGGVGGAESSIIDAAGVTFVENVAGTGGGLYAQGCQSSLVTCEFRGNVAAETPTSNGGAISTLGGDLVMQHGTLDVNTADFDGGAVHLEATASTVTDTTFTANDGGRFGGGLSVELGVATVVRGSFLGNRAPFGGGVFGFASTVELRDSICAGNAATGFRDDDGACVTPGAGGGFGAAAGEWTIVNCTIAGNTAACDGTGGGLSQILGDVSNTILWANADGGGRDESAQIHGGVLAISHSSVEGWTGDLGGAGNVGTPPQFRDQLGPDGTPGTADDDLRLAAGSPLIDAGRNDAVTTSLDRDARPRLVDDAATVDTGTGRPPLVDMGAYETQTTPGCAGDLDGSGDVGLFDLLTVIGHWGVCDDPGACPADLDGDGVVGLLDLLRLLAGWGGCGAS